MIDTEVVPAVAQAHGVVSPEKAAFLSARDRRVEADLAALRLDCRDRSEAIAGVVRTLDEELIEEAKAAFASLDDLSAERAMALRIAAAQSRLASGTLVYPGVPAVAAGLACEAAALAETDAAHWLASGQIRIASGEAGAASAAFDRAIGAVVRAGLNEIQAEARAATVWQTDVNRIVDAPADYAAIDVRVYVDLSGWPDRSFSDLGRREID
jgi:hypothetical protein